MAVLRFNDDLGVNQLKSTTPVNTIIQNYKNFKLKWDDEIAKFNVTGKARNALKNVYKHITKGCLSAIPKSYILLIILLIYGREITMP